MESQEQFKSEVDSKHKEMIDLLESITVDSLKAEGLTLSFGGKTFQFSDITVIENETLEDKIRKEYKDKLNDQQQKIRDKINQKINQLLLLHQNKQQEFNRKENELKRKYSESAMMPDINERHLMKGLSVVKGGSNDELLWIYRAVYNPKYIIDYNGSGMKQRKAIKARFVNRMKTPILIITRTKKESILSITTKKIDNDNGVFNNFPHYHQTGTSDCWGSWKHPSRWNTPDDIINMSKEAEAILETINHGSIASRSPVGLPRIQTLLDNLMDIKDVKQSKKSNGLIVTDEDVWSS